MTVRPANWRMPSIKAGRPRRHLPSLQTTTCLPHNGKPFWKVGPSESSMAALRLTEIPQHLLRVSCRRCSRNVEIQKIDAIRLYGERDDVRRCFELVAAPAAA